MNNIKCLELSAIFFRHARQQRRNSWSVVHNAIYSGNGHSTFRSVSTFFGKEYYKRNWHDPSFMEHCQPETVEQWLVSILSSSNNREGNRAGISDDGVDSIAYLRVLEAYAKSKIAGAPQKTEYWIGQLERVYKEAAKFYLQQYTSASNRSLESYSSENASTSSATIADYEVHTSPFAKFIASKSTVSNQDIQESQNTPDNHASYIISLQPTTECYNAVIEAWGNDGDKVSVVRSRRWLSKLEEGIHEHCPFPPNHPLHYTLKPDARSYDLYLHSCSRGIGKHHKVLRQRAEEAEELLKFRLSDNAQISIRPTTESYNYVIRAWTRCRREMCAAEKVMALVREMESIQRDYIKSKYKSRCGDDSWQQHISPNTKTYTMAMDSWIIVAGLKASHWYSQQLELNNTYNQLSRNKRNTLEDRERYLGRMNKIDDGSVEMENAASVLQYIQTLESAGRSDINATVVGFNTILSGWARLANDMRPEIPLKSEAILRDMMEFYEDGNKKCRPDVMSFNAVSGMILLLKLQIFMLQ